MSIKTTKVDRLPTIRRLPAYLHYLRMLARVGNDFVSSAHLAEIAGVEPILVRKDLELTGVSGTRRVGYSIPELIKAIEDFLGWGDTVDAFLIGVGHLGAALLGYKDFTKFGLNVVAAFDSDPMKINSTLHGIRIFDVTKIPDLMKRLNVRLAVLTLPSDEAQAVTDILVESGIQGIWNFTYATLDVPDYVAAHNEDLIPGYAVLSVKMAQNNLTQ